MYLNEALPNESYYIRKLHTKGILRCRMRELGIIEGTQIKSLFCAPFGDPVAYLVRGTVLAIRNCEAAEIEIEPVKNDE